MARFKLTIIAFLAICMTFSNAGIIDSIKSALGLSSSSTSSAINVPSGNNLPKYFRVEAELLRIENPTGIKSNGGSCDTVGQCDPVVHAFLDVVKPVSPFPGAQTVESFPKVFSVDDVNSPKINTLVSADVCNKELTKATLRVHVMDRNALFTDSLISDFDCYVGGNVANSLQDAKWSSSGNCAGKFIPDKIKLFFRSRMYRINPTQCVDATMTPPATTTAKSFFG